MLEPFLAMMLQSAVAKVRSLPLGGLVGYAAPVDRRMFFAIHKMLVAQLERPGAGQGISMDRKGCPPQVAGVQSGPDKFAFHATLAEVVADIVGDRSWNLRAATPLEAGGPKPDAQLVHWGPVFHHADGSIGCIAAPLEFGWQANMPFHGVRADRAYVKHDYFVLDTGGEWSGMGQTPHRTEDAAGQTPHRTED